MNIQQLKDEEKTNFIKSTVDSLYQSVSIIDAETRQIQSVIELLTNKDPDCLDDIFDEIIGYLYEGITSSTNISENLLMLRKKLNKKLTPSNQQ